MKARGTAGAGSRAEIIKKRSLQTTLAEQCIQSGVFIEDRGRLARERCGEQAYREDMAYALSQTLLPM